MPPIRGNRKTTRGRPCTYDWDLGRKLWMAGKTPRFIADTLGIPHLGPTHVRSAAARYDWPRRQATTVIKYEVVKSA